MTWQEKVDQHVGQWVTILLARQGSPKSSRVDETEFEPEDVTVTGKLVSVSHDGEGVYEDERGTRYSCWPVLDLKRVELPHWVAVPDTFDPDVDHGGLTLIHDARCHRESCPIAYEESACGLGQYFVHRDDPQKTWREERLHPGVYEVEFWSETYRGPEFDEMDGGLRTKQELSVAPPKTQEMIDSGHQVWAGMNGPLGPHWEVRGTGARISPDDLAELEARRAQLLAEHDEMETT